MAGFEFLFAMLFMQHQGKPARGRAGQRPENLPEIIRIRRLRPQGLKNNKPGGFCQMVLEAISKNRILVHSRNGHEFS